MKVSQLMLLIMFLPLAGCSPPEQNYRGVPSPVWKHLTAEQKQLIIDRTYEDEKVNNE